MARTRSSSGSLGAAAAPAQTTTADAPGGPEPFQVGFSMSTWQSSGDQFKGATNWGIFERQRSWFGMPTIVGNARCGQSCNFWDRYEEDLELAASMGSNCFRLSLEWHRIEPQRGQVDQDAIQRFKDILDCCRRKGMEPHVTLHHFVHPAWFERLGGFNKEENIALFLDYTRTCYRHFGPQVKFWATFNEPGVFSFAGHVYGSFPPGNLARVASCARHLLNMFRAHGQAYDTIKAMPGGKDAQIGIVWNYFWFEPKRYKYVTPFYLPFVSRLLNRLWGNDLFMNFLRTGEFDWNPLPWVFSKVHHKESRPPGCDFIGLNYYSRGVMDWKLSASCNEGEVMTDMPYSLYPEGLTLAVHHMSKLGVPVYITETGVADSGDERRPVMIQNYMEQIERTVAMGYDLRGVMYWSLMDNFEWNFGFTMRFGMIRWENDGTQKRHPRKSVPLLERWYEKLPRSVAQLLEQRRQGKGGKGLEEAVDGGGVPLLQSVGA